MNKFQTAAYVWRFLSPLPLFWRLHQVARSFMSPFAALIEHIPHSIGRPLTLIDIGCGHGVFLALAKQSRPDLELIGIDLSEEKIAAARKAFQAAGLVARELAVHDIADFAPGLADIITMLDVMYLVPLHQWGGVLEKCFACLRPGGVLLMKEMNREISGKFRVLYAEEILAVKVLGLTMGEQFTFPSPAEIRDRLARVGFAVEQVALDRGYHVPHALWIARKSA